MTITRRLYRDGTSEYEINGVPCRLLDIHLETGTSFLIYLSGMTLSVTPGKMGEVFKSWRV